MMSEKDFNSDLDGVAKRELDEVLAELIRLQESAGQFDVDAFIQSNSKFEAQIRDFLKERLRQELTDITPQDTREEKTLVKPLSSDAAQSQTEEEVVKHFGDYQLQSEIARGGMGVVYKAVQTSLNRPVALKMILAGGLASERDVERFKTEAESAANLNHPNIVPIFEIGEQEGQHYFSMALIEGSSLSDRIADSPIPSKEAAQLVETLAEAVQYAHDHGVIHRDLKPSNVLIDRNGSPMITDFGLAKKDTEVGPTATGEMLGTPGYMAPEQASGRSEHIKKSADIYGLGAVLYAAITGRPPFQAATILDTLTQVLEKEPVSAIVLNTQIPRDLNVICMKCLQKNPAKRYSSAGELADDLRRFLAGRTIKARPVSKTEKCLKWIRRKPAVASLIAAVALVFVLGNAGIIWQWNEAEKERIKSGKLAEKEKRAREKSDKNAAALEKSERNLKIELHKSRLVQADNLLKENANSRAEALYWSEHLTSPHQPKPTPSIWRLTQFYWEFPKQGRIGNDVSYFSQNGSRIAFTHSNKLEVFDTQENKTIAQFESKLGDLYRPIVSDTGDLVACGHTTRREILVWQLNSPESDPILLKSDFSIKYLLPLDPKQLEQLGNTKRVKEMMEISNELVYMSSPYVRFVSDEKLVGLYRAGHFVSDLKSVKFVEAEHKGGIRSEDRLIGLDSEREHLFIKSSPPVSSGRKVLITKINLVDSDAKPEYLYKVDDKFQFLELDANVTPVNGVIAKFLATENSSQFLIGMAPKSSTFILCKFSKRSQTLNLKSAIFALLSFLLTIHLSELKDQFRS